MNIPGIFYGLIPQKVECTSSNGFEQRSTTSTSRLRIAMIKGTLLNIQSYFPLELQLRLKNT